MAPAREGRVRIQGSKSGDGRDLPVLPSVLAMLDLPVLPSVLAMLDLDRLRGRWLLEHPRGDAGSRDCSALRNNVIVPARPPGPGWGLVTTHDLRHTAASFAIVADADVIVVQAMLGHASVALALDLYGHLRAGGLDGWRRGWRACSTPPDGPPTPT